MCPHQQDEGLKKKQIMKSYETLGFHFWNPPTKTQLFYQTFVCNLIPSLSCFPYMLVCVLQTSSPKSVAEPACDTWFASVGTKKHLKQHQFGGMSVQGKETRTMVLLSCKTLHPIGFSKRSIYIYIETSCHGSRGARLRSTSPEQQLEDRFR